MSKVNLFDQVPTVQAERNIFQRNYQWKGTVDSGLLIPVFWEEVLPGDTKKLNTTFFGRMTTPIVPIMDNVYLDYHLFFIPRRLIWDNWEKFMGERKNPSDSIDYLLPTIKAEKAFEPGSFFDYLGWPTGIVGVTGDVGYINAYRLCWNEWYRDQNLQDSIDISTADGPFTYQGGSALLRRGKRMDYFTTCLPQPQKGPGVDLPLSGNAVIKSGEPHEFINQITNKHISFAKNPGQPITSGGGGLGLSDSGWLYESSQPAGPLKINSVKIDNLYADLNDITAVTINSLRQAFALQQFLELDMRGGTRYIELILSHFGVRSPDYRLQRPEYLGGGTTNLYVSTVPQTSSTDATTPQGNLSAYATFQSTGNGFVQSFTEHGIILGLASIRADLNYQQGLDRHFSRKTRYDFFWTSLSHLGEQAVLNKEIYSQGNDEDNGVFGYQERYAEYRYRQNIISGKLRSTDPQSLDIWHLAQKFDKCPKLNSEFIEEHPPIKRVLAVQDEPEFMIDAYHEFTDIRPVPLYGTPGLSRM